jgi:hypothetical protein
MKFLNQIYEDAAATTGSVYIDTWSVASAGATDTVGDSTKLLYASDGIHFKSVGYRLIASRVVRLLRHQNGESEQEGQPIIAH